VAPVGASSEIGKNYSLLINLVALNLPRADGIQSEILQMVESGKLDMGLGVFGPTPGIRRTPFFRFSLMIIRADSDSAAHRASTTWSSLQGEDMISLPHGSPIQKMVDKHLTKAGVVCRIAAVVNLLDTQIAMVEAGEGIAVIPAFGLAAVRNRHVVMSRLVSPVVNLDFFQISDRGKTLPSGANEFTAFLKSYISRWAGRSGPL
jgi:LysR family transcriptional regulator, carnitine catabolism transcriptional activator